MIYEFPDDIEKFSCIASRCPDTCCAGWEVDIDEETALWYKSIPGSFGERLRASLKISEEDGSEYFPLDEGGRCPFLNDRNLCDIYTALGGETALSRVCTEYPRYYAEVGDYEQIDMSLSCMEYGRIFFSSGRRRLVRAEDELTESESENIDEERLLNILDFRDFAVELMQSGEGSWDRRLEKIEKAAPAALGCVSDPPDYYGDEDDAALLDRISSLELIDERWAARARAVEHFCARHRDKTSSEKGNATFENKPELSGKMEAWFTKLSVYFLFRYIIDVYYDEDAWGVFRLINRSLRYIFLMTEAEALKKAGALIDEDIINLSHMYSKEVEHSEENLQVMKKR